MTDMQGMSRREWRERERNASASQRQGGPTDAVAALFAPHEAAAGGRPATILTVCTGNICRSPMAEVLVRSRVGSLGVRVHSAGTHALVDHEMTGPAQEIAVELGAEPAAAAAHRARYLIDPMLLEADLVLAMSREHRSYAVQLAPSVLRRTFTLREFARLASTLSDDEVRAVADAAGSDPAARLRAAALAVTGQRGLSAPAPDEDDIIDPYRRSRETYELSASQLAPAVDDVERIVRAAL